MKKKILILTMTCGEGHNAIARSLKGLLEENNIVQIVDIFDHIPSLKSVNSDGLLFLHKYLSKPYEFVWNKLRKRDPDKRFTGMPFNAIKKCIPHIKNVILNFNPDIVISTHCYAGNIVSVLKHDKIYNKKSYCLLTDYVDCPYWELSIYNDFVFTPNELTHKYLLPRGFKEKQFIVSGYPINDIYEIDKDKTELRKKYNVSPDDFVILISGGGYGLNNPKKIIKQLLKSNLVNKKYRILCLCGRNEKQKINLDKFITKNNLKNITTYEFINYVDELLTISDVIFCRGGAGTISEAIRKHVVPIIREKCICNEQINKDLFIKENIALGLNKTSDIIKTINFCLDNPNKLNEMRKNMEGFYKKGATKFIAEVVSKI